MPKEVTPMKRDPYDLRTWGTECGRGVRHMATSGFEQQGKASGHKISAGRKHRGMASDSFSKEELCPKK